MTQKFKNLVDIFETSMKKFNPTTYNSATYPA
jgi:hypothetical protein